eukprot:CAMPEP_0115260060 /NCGR_PEP_ID=MMETSP0270-20121206/48143_1 /TAXON_ID=71861 /ORGANISM="Scrippsiella trochoidea, Strain CCMP3099" /LENGTH=49 /DNA_ID= /DNA_START= /DNA_END= /DNA_ORIENTATION=
MTSIGLKSPRHPALQLPQQRDVPGEADTTSGEHRDRGVARSMRRLMRLK